MADTIRATPRNPVLGLFSDITQSGLDYLRDPRFRQSMMQLPAPVRPFGMGAVALPGLFESTGLPKTLERASYGQPLTNIGMANVPLLKPETADLLMNVAPFAPAALRGAAATGRFVAPKAGQLAEGYMQRMGMMPGILPTGSKATSKIDEITGLPLNSDGTVTLFHHTNKSAAEQIAKSGRLKSAGEPSVYLTTQKATDTGYGDVAVPVRVKPSLLNLDDEFPGGRMDFSIDTGKPKGSISVIVEKQLPQAPQQASLDLAQQRAALPVSEGGLGLPAGNTAEQRAAAMGFDTDWYHGTTGDITNFKTNLLGEATGAPSAKKAFFFARDPQNPPASMLVKTTDQSSIDMLKRLGIPDEEIAKLNTVSMQGHGAETASGYAQIGGSREYRDAMRKANAAEKNKNWDEYEKQMQIAEDSEINRMREAQSLVARYGDARDEMLSTIQNTIYSKKLPQAEAEALDLRVKQLMPYGWYNSYSQPQLSALKKEIVNIVGEDAATPVLKQIDNFKAVKAERALVEHTQEGGNVMPVALRYKNPLIHDFQGQPYRDQSYSDLIDQAIAGGHDAVIMKNTYDPGGSGAKLIDVGAIFSPDQIRSRFAAFDPLRKTAAIAAAAGLAAPDLLANELDYPSNPMYTDPLGYSIR